MRFDVQSAGLERPSVDGVLRMLTHMSFMCNPRAPVHVPDEVLAALPPDPIITALEQEQEQLKAGAYRIQGTSIQAEVRHLPPQLVVLGLGVGTLSHKNTEMIISAAAQQKTSRGITMGIKRKSTSSQ